MDHDTRNPRPPQASSGPRHRAEQGGRRLVYSFYQAGGAGRERPAPQPEAPASPAWEEPPPPAPEPSYSPYEPYEPQEAYGSQGAYEPQGAYRSQSAYEPQGGYEPQAAHTSILDQYALPKAPPRSEVQAQRRRRKVDKRALLEKRASLLVLGFLTAGFCVLTLLILLLPRSTESKIEKRDLAKLPQFSLGSYFSGAYTAGIATYFTDTVPMRDSLKNAGNNFKALFGLPQSEGDVQFVGKVNKVNKDSQASAPAQPSPAASQPESSGSAGPSSAPVGAPQGSLEGAAGRHMEEGPVSTQPPAKVDIAQDFDWNNGMILVKTDGHYRGLELFGGGIGDAYAQALNDLYREVGANVNIWSMPAPKASEFYTPESAAEYNASQSKCIDETAALLDPGIHSINVCPALAQHANEPIYCRTDHHWQPLGAYYAAQAFASAAGLPFDDLSTYQEGKIENFVGTLYSVGGVAELLNDPEDFVYYRPAKEHAAVYYDTTFDFIWDDDDLFQEGAEGSDAYLYYLGGDQYVVKADTQTQNGRKLLLIKDSYGNALPPFLTGSFQQIYAADMRYFERNLVSFIRDMGITDVLFTMTTYSMVGDNADNLSNLLTQNAGETVTDDQPAGGSEGGEE